MIIVKITGGLGNQMFQYAAGYAETKKRRTVLKLDLSAYSSGKRRYELGYFMITAQKANSTDILLHKYFLPTTYIHGDFQGEKYFKNSIDALKQQYTLKNPITIQYHDLCTEILSTNSVAVHIRRADYLDKQHRYTILEPTYYMKAMQYISAQIAQPKYFFFSDDIDWVKEHITYPADSVFVSDGPYQDREELILMSMCKHQIIANSTFSWWAAWLNKNPEKIVITPTRWFTDAYTQDPDLIPSSWIRI